MRNRTTETNKIGSVLMAVLAFFAVLGSATFGIRLSTFMLSPFRILLVILLAAGLFTATALAFSSEVSMVYKYWVILFLYACLSVFGVADRGSWLSGVIYLAIGLLILFLFLRFNGIIDFFPYYRFVTAIMLIIVSVWGWYEMRTGNYIFLRNAEFLKIYSYADKRCPVVFFGNTNNFALFVSFSLLLLFPMLLDSSIVKKLLYIGMAVLSFPLIIMSDSRANVIGLAIGIVVWLVIRMKSRLTLTQMIVISAVLIAASIVFVLFWDTISNAINNFFYFTGSKASSSKSNFIRTNSTLNGFLMILNSAGFGVGCGNSSVPGNHTYNTLGIYELHDWWLVMLSEYGLVFGIAYFVIYIIQTKRLFDYIREEENEKHKMTLTSFAAIDIAFVLCLTSPSGVVAIEWIWVYWGIRYAWVNKYCLKYNSL